MTGRPEHHQANAARSRDGGPDMGFVADNVARIRDQIAEAAHAAGRSADEVTLMAVTKTRTAAEVDVAIAAGVRVVGENRVQEARAKQPDVSGAAEWHMIGHLQTNKVNQALGLFSTIQSVDTLRLAERISRQASGVSKTVNVLVEVNTSGEKTKSGVSPDGARDLIWAVRELPGLHVRGLMTIGAFVDDERQVRSCFRLLRELRDTAESPGGERLPVLSMGMTHDFAWAVAEGSTMVRVGTAIFGPRVAGH